MSLFQSFAWNSEIGAVRWCLKVSDPMPHAQFFFLQTVLERRNEY